MLLDTYFGQLLFTKSNRKNDSYFEGRVKFKSTSREIELYIGADLKRPTNNQKAFVGRIQQDMEEDDNYGVNIEKAHPRAVELVPEEFFWSGIDELSPFGSDEGDMALAEYRDWRVENPKGSALEAIIWTIESVGEINIDEYNDSILNSNLIQQQLENKDFDDQQYIYTVDISVIACGFGQLVDEGKIDFNCKPLIGRAITRQKIWAGLSVEWSHATEYINNMNVLERVLHQA